MRAKFIYESFKEDSDPIRDMKIGGCIENLYDKAIELTRNDSNFLTAWIEYLNYLEGKVIIGRFKEFNYIIENSKLIYKIKNTEKKFKKLKIYHVSSKWIPEIDDVEHEKDKRFIFIIAPNYKSYYVCRDELYRIIE
jgi:hypothetical protein